MVQIQGLHIRDLISLLQPLGNLTHCKFTNEEKSQAYVKFSNIEDACAMRARVAEMGAQRGFETV